MDRRASGYAPGLDGLRAVACGSVFLFHAGVLHLTGGFLGVSMFFTLSGFLITSLLLDELDSEGGLSLRGFWRRRFFRIVLLYATVIVVWTAWGLAAGGRLGHQTVVGGIGSVALVVNWLVAYHAPAAGVLNGDWSVCVEEQFYVTWPLILAGLHRILRTRERIAAAVCVGVVLIAIHRLAIAPQGYVRSWFATDTQADAILIGCLVALGWRSRRLWIQVAAAAALGGALFTGHSDLTAIRWLMPIVAVSTAAVIPLVMAHPGVLGSRPFVAIGRRSFGIYLWGCPVVYLLDTRAGLHGARLVLASVVVTALLVEPTYRYIETPMRRRGRREARVSSSGPAAALRSAG